MSVFKTSSENTIRRHFHRSMWKSLHRIPLVLRESVVLGRWTRRRRNFGLRTSSIRRDLHVHLQCILVYGSTNVGVYMCIWYILNRVLYKPLPNLLLEQGCLAIMAWHVSCVWFLRIPTPFTGSIALSFLPHWDSTRFPTSYQLVTWLPHLESIHVPPTQTVLWDSASSIYLAMKQLLRFLKC